MAGLKAGHELQTRLNEAMNTLGLPDWGRYSLAAKWAGMTPGGLQRAIKRGSILRHEHAFTLISSLGERLTEAGHPVSQIALSQYLMSGGLPPWSKDYNPLAKESIKLTVDSETFQIVLCLQKAAASYGKNLFTDIDSQAIERHLSRLKAIVQTGIPADSETLKKIAEILLASGF